MTYLLLLSSLHSESVIKSCRGHSAAEGSQHPTSPTQDTKVTEEAQSHSNKLALHCHTSSKGLLDCC